jgi:hypothetical protein
MMEIHVIYVLATGNIRRYVTEETESISHWHKLSSVCNVLGTGLRALPFSSLTLERLLYFYTEPRCQVEQVSDLYSPFLLYLSTISHCVVSSLTIILIIYHSNLVQLPDICYGNMLYWLSTKCSLYGCACCWHLCNSNVCLYPYCFSLIVAPLYILDLGTYIRHTYNLLYRSALMGGQKARAVRQLAVCSSGCSAELGNPIYYIRCLKPWVG